MAFSSLALPLETDRLLFLQRQDKQRRKCGGISYQQRSACTTTLEYLTCLKLSLRTLCFWKRVVASGFILYI